MKSHQETVQIVEKKGLLTSAAVRPLTAIFGCFPINRTSKKTLWP